MDPRILEAAGLLAFSGSAVIGATGYFRARTARLIAASQVGEPPLGIVRRLAAPLAGRLRPTSQSDLEQLVSKLQRAGRRDRNEVDRFLEEKVIGAFFGMSVGLLLGATIGGGVGFFLLIGMMAAGLLGPDHILDIKQRRRKDSVSAGMPSCVDLLVTCLDAGLSVEGALVRVARDTKHSNPTLAEELGITASELDAGVNLPDALRRLARRVGLDDLSAMCGVIAQAHSLGAPIAMTLREYAISTRRQRMSTLEERAGQLSSQITLPLALCLLPSALLIILGPAAIQLMDAFGN